MNLRLEGRRALVVGGGAVALRKARALARAGARVAVVAPRIGAGFGRFETRRRAFRAGDVRGASVVVAATDDAAVNRRVHAACRARGIPVNVVDVPELCTFTVPAVFRRGKLTIAVSTDGEAPALAGAIRRDLERRYAGLVERMARERRAGPAGPGRRRAMRKLARRFESSFGRNRPL